MKLVFLSQANLTDEKFIHEFVHSFSSSEKSILLHDHFGAYIEDTRFVTKRLSALLSEENVVNSAFSGDQRTIFKKHNEGGISFRSDFVKELMQHLQLLILNPIAVNGIGSVEANPVDVIKAIREGFDIDEIIIFPQNSKSPLGKEKKTVGSRDDFEKLALVFEEEKSMLEIALALSPAVIASASNFQL